MEDRSTVDQFARQDDVSKLIDFGADLNEKRFNAEKIGRRIDKSSPGDLATEIDNAVNNGCGKVDANVRVLEDHVGGSKSYFCYKCNCDVTNIKYGAEIKCPTCGDSFLEEKASTDFADVSTVTI